MIGEQLSSRLTYAYPGGVPSRSLSELRHPHSIQIAATDFYTLTVKRRRAGLTLENNIENSEYS